MLLPPPSSLLPLALLALLAPRAAAAAVARRNHPPSSGDGDGDGDIDPARYLGPDDYGADDFPYDAAPPPPAFNWAAAADWMQADAADAAPPPPPPPPRAASPEPTALADRFVVSLNPAASDAEVEAHLRAVTDALAAALPPELQGGARNISAALARAAVAHRGVLGSFRLPGFRAYHGHFPDWLVQIIKASPLQQQAPWHLARLNVGARRATAALASNSPDLTYSFQHNPGAGVDVYILDTGIRTSHAEFDGRAVFGATFSDDGPDDGQGHGTHVAAIVAGSTFGVAKAARVVAVKVMDNSGKGAASQTIAGLEWIVHAAASNRTSIINYSVAGAKSAALTAAFESAVSQGIAVVAAAGNSNGDACNSSPQESRSVLVVGATDINDAPLGVSNFGRCVSLYAPGVQIVSASNVSDTASQLRTGSSQAAPHVAGQLAVLAAANPDALPANLYAAVIAGSIRGAVVSPQPDTPNILLSNGIPYRPASSARQPARAAAIAYADQAMAAHSQDTPSAPRIQNIAAVMHDDIKITDRFGSSISAAAAAGLAVASKARIAAADDSSSSSTAAADATDRYIVSLIDSISQEDIDSHYDAIANALKGNLTALGGVPAALARLIPSSDVLAKYKGIAGKFISGALKGYHGHFPDWLVQIVKSSPLVKYVEQDKVVALKGIEIVNSTRVGLILAANVSTAIQIDPPSWGLDRITHRGSGFEGRYVYPTTAGSGVDIYILDTGINTAHPDFGGRASFGASFSSEGDNDDNGHGTHVAGTTASTTYGVAKFANVVAVKVLGKDGSGLMSAVMSGIDWVVSKAKSSGRPSVVNLSLGGTGTSQAMNQLVAAAVGQGVVFSVAAGNSAVDACGNSPQDSPVVLTVGAATPTDTRASFSNFGSCVGIFAPGTNITSTSRTGATQIMSGTSQAAPHVAGQMAVILSLQPTLLPSQVIAAIKNTGTGSALSALKENDPNLLLYNGLDTTPLSGTAAGGRGDDFSIVSDRGLPRAAAGFSTTPAVISQNSSARKTKTDRPAAPTPTTTDTPTGSPAPSDAPTSPKTKYAPSNPRDIGVRFRRQSRIAQQTTTRTSWLAESLLPLHSGSIPTRLVARSAPRDFTALPLAEDGDGGTTAATSNSTAAGESITGTTTTTTEGSNTTTDATTTTDTQPRTWTIDDTNSLRRLIVAGVGRHQVVEAMGPHVRASDVLFVYRRLVGERGKLWARHVTVAEMEFMLEYIARRRRAWLEQRAAQQQLEQQQQQVEKKVKKEKKMKHEESPIRNSSFVAMSAAAVAYVGTPPERMHALTPADLARQKVARPYTATSGDPHSYTSLLRPDDGCVVLPSDPDGLPIDFDELGLRLGRTARSLFNAYRRYLSTGRIHTLPASSIPKNRRKLGDEPRKYRTEQGKAVAEQRKAGAEQRKAGAEQRKAGAEQRKAGAEQRKAGAEQRKAEIGLPEKRKLTASDVSVADLFKDRLGPDDRPE
ncbi:hypothetical protein HK105_206711 [Polyrhizophydium stewartii]|uniref:Peptidase S8/S53 domain-containing protein n=1 Tax=Polyrhizophydium stewartii TaxID=2732419 RepID=A0ABR4N2U8_9FUNG